MLARAFFVISLAFLHACQGNYPKLTECAADGGCSSKAGACTGGSCHDAAERMDDGVRAPNGARTEAMRAKKDGGSDAAVDASSSSSSSSSSSMRKDSASKSGSGGKAKAKKPATVDSGTHAADGDAAVGCRGSCGECEACAENSERCEPVTGQDDADSCSDTRSCSSKGQCLYIREAQAELGDTLEWFALTRAYAQILTFSEPTSVQEIRLEVSCTEGEQLFPPAWIAAASGGVPSNSIIAFANIVYQAPADAHSFALLELSKVLEKAAGESIAIVVGETDMSCIVRVNKPAPYLHGDLFEQNEQGDWNVSEGSMVFQVLSSK